jgi:hypothetical protein
MFQTSKIHIFQTSDPKVTNYMSLESLGSLESIGRIKPLGFCIKFWNDFQIELNHYLVYLIYIFCSTSPIIIFL